jgi:hypothetical protein
MSFAATALYVAYQRVYIAVDFVIDSVRKLLDTPSYRNRYLNFAISALWFHSGR